MASFITWRDTNGQDQKISVQYDEMEAAAFEAFGHLINGPYKLPAGLRACRPAGPKHGTAAFLLGGLGSVEALYVPILQAIMDVTASLWRYQAICSFLVPFARDGHGHYSDLASC